MLTTYLFIDGGHLREGFKTWASRCYGTEVQPEISQARFALQAIGITGGLEKCFYYDCVDERKNEAESPEEFKHRVAAQEELFNSIRRVPGWHVPEGRLVGSRKQSRQKRVDVLLTVEMLSHAFNKNMGHAILIAGDDDFTTPDFREKMKSHMRKLAADGGAPELAAALRESVEQRTAAFAAQPAAFWDHYITRFDGQRVTRLEMMQMIKEHEMTHRAHMFLCLRMKGIVPATTRRRLAKQAGK